MKAFANDKRKLSQDLLEGIFLGIAVIGNWPGLDMAVPPSQKGTSAMWLCERVGL